MFELQYSTFVTYLGVYVLKTYTFRLLTGIGRDIWLVKKLQQQSADIATEDLA